jgi:hypothetical protein
MDLDRATLARIDRSLLAGLGQDETFQMVRVPVTAAKWATWKRYCGAAGLSMGRAITALIERELVTVFGDSTEDEVPVFAMRAAERLAVREEQVSAREGAAKDAEERISRQDKRLRLWEEALEAREQRNEQGSKLLARSKATAPKVGRNERCPCGSGLKHKYCHAR